MYRFKSSDIGKKFFIAGFSDSGDSGSIAFDIDYSRVYGSIGELQKSVIASDDSQDRHGEVVRSEGWMVDEFKKNPTMLWAHDNYLPAIGAWENLRFDEKSGRKRMVADPHFDVEGEGDGVDKFARLIAAKVKRGFIKAVSVGFMPLEFDRELNSIKHELLEISWVNIGANRGALREQEKAENISHSKLIEDYLSEKWTALVK